MSFQFKAIDLFSPIDLWNKYDVALKGDCRTNHICEGWNQVFKLAAGQGQPPLYTLLKALQADEANASLLLSRSTNGQPLRTGVCTTITTYNYNLRAYCQQYQCDHYQYDMVGYLRNINHNIRYRAG